MVVYRSCRSIPAVCVICAARHNAVIAQGIPAIMLSDKSSPFTNFLQTKQESKTEFVAHAYSDPDSIVFGA